MKSFLYFIAAMTLPLSAQAATYICKDGDRAVYSTIKLNPGCTLSQMNGVSNDAPAENHRPRTTDKIERVWEAEQSSALGDIKISPSARDTTVTNTAEAASPSLEIKLRNGRAKKQPVRRPIVVPHITTAPAKQQLSRKHILQGEIRNEQTALSRTKTQLAAARKKGDQAKITRFEQEIRDREASIRAIQAEMKR